MEILQFLFGLLIGLVKLIGGLILGVVGIALGAVGCSVGLVCGGIDRRPGGCLWASGFTANFDLLMDFRSLRLIAGR